MPLHAEIDLIYAKSYSSGGPKRPRWGPHVPLAWRTGSENEEAQKSGSSGIHRDEGLNPASHIQHLQAVIRFREARCALVLKFQEVVSQLGFRWSLVFSQKPYQKHTNH